MHLHNSMLGNFFRPGVVTQGAMLDVEPYETMNSSRAKFEFNQVQHFFQNTRTLFWRVFASLPVVEVLLNVAQSSVGVDGL